jgi:hypothetical protein
MTTTAFSGTRDDLLAMVRRLPAVLAGREADALGIARGLQLRLAVALLSRVQQAFVAKARGGVGDDGVKWAPLKRSTIAHRRTTAGERKAAGAGGKRTRGLLTAAQDRRWKQVFGSRLAQMLARGMGLGAAKARAAQIAWAVLKGEGALTKLAAFGGRQVEIGRDTGRMFRSLSPGTEDRPSGAPEQVLRVEPGRVTVGTNVPYAAPFHKRRPLWRTDGTLPEAWANYLVGAYARGLQRALADALAKR